MPRNGAWLLVVAGAASAAALVGRRAGPSRESLLPVLRAGEEHGLQLERTASSVLPLDADEERRLGESLRRLMPPDARQARLTALGRRLERTGIAKRYAGRYEYAVVPDAAPNAFTTPGGFVFVTAGLLDKVGEDSSAISFALAHELSHSELGHTADLVRYKAWLDRYDVPGGDLVQALRVLPAQAYSRTQELEADTLALAMMRKADLRLQAAVDVLEAVDRSPDEAAGTHRDPGAVLIEGLTDYFHSHPGKQERLDNIRAIIGRQPAAARSVP